MNHAKQIKVQKKQDKNNMVGETFSVLEKNQRRKQPWLGGSWFEPGREEEREKFIAKWNKETENMLKNNPNLVIVD